MKHHHPHSAESNSTAPETAHETNLATDRRALLAGIGGLAAGALLAGKAQAGPLNPPPGPISSTPGPEPRIPINAQNTPGTANAVFRITQAGSYYLTENLLIPSGLVGIEIAQSDVSIDLNGFVISSTINTSSDAIAVPSIISRRNITIRNGSIITCGGVGINLGTCSHNAVEHIHVRSNTGDGIRSGDSSRVADCRAENNGGRGLVTGQNCIVQNCTAQGSGSTGIDAGSSSVIQNCTAIGNGSHGLNASSGCAVNACTARGNTGAGIKASLGVSITDCTAFVNFAGGIDTDIYCTISQTSANGNTGIGIRTGLASSVNECTANNNTISGFSASSKSTIANCTAYSNRSDGFQAFQNNTITNCTSSDNEGHGISVTNGCAILDCTATFNSLDGIRFANECLVRGNNATYAGNITGNGTAIHATGQLNRIEANLASRSNRGIQADGQGNVIVRNTCTSNSGGNYVLAANNVYGPILNRTAPASVAVIGNSAASTLGSTDANANYAH